jgi:hypothetical protein
LPGVLASARQALRGSGGDALELRQLAGIAAPEPKLAAIESEALRGVAGFGLKLLEGVAGRPEDTGHFATPSFRVASNPTALRRLS